jgi:endoglucanase
MNFSKRVTGTAAAALIAMGLAGWCGGKAPESDSERIPRGLPRGKRANIRCLFSTDRRFPAACGGELQSPLNPSGFSIRRGVNLSHWLSQDFGWSPKYTSVREADIRFIRDIGYDHVRIPIDEMEMWDEKGKPVTEAFRNLSDCLGWCDAAGLAAIVDLHILRSHHFNAANEGGRNVLWTDSTAQDHFVSLWMELSDSLRSWPVNRVAYELLNEAVAPEHEDWNKLLNKAAAAIRSREPDRVLVIGPNMWQIAPNLRHLRLPEGDRNLILSFHTYSPLAFTHYKADWTPFRSYAGNVHYPGPIISEADYSKFIAPAGDDVKNQAADARDDWNRERLVDVFRDGLAFAREKGLQLYCGEFGCMPTVERIDRLKFYEDQIAAFEENGVAWCNWEYKGDFGVYTWDPAAKASLEPDSSLIAILLGGRKAE